MFSTIVSDYSWYWLAICAAFAAAMAAAAYYRNSKLQEFSPWKIKLLAALRLIATFAASLLLLNIFVRRTTSRTEKPALIIAADDSESVTMRGQGAQDSLMGIKSQIAGMAERLSDKYSVKTFAFGDNVRPADIGSLAFSDKYTDMSQLIEAMQPAMMNTGAGALVILSDGICTRGQDPLYAAQNLGKKIHTVMLGDTSAYKDISVSRCTFNETAFLGNEFPIQIAVNARMLEGSKTLCEIARNGKTLFSKSIDISTSEHSQEISAVLKADIKGLNKYTISLTPADGEITLENNTRDIVVEVVDDKRKVLILSAMPHPDAAAARNALASSRGLDVDVATINQMGKRNLSDYDLLVLVQLPSESASASGIINEIKQKGMPALYILGQSTDYEKFSEISSCLKISKKSSSFENASYSENAMFSLLSFESGAAELLSQAPPLSCAFGTYSLMPGTQAFGNQIIKGVPTDKPMIAISEQQKAREAVIAGEGIWRWRIDCFRRYLSHEKFDLMITRLAQYLLSSGGKERLSVSVRSIFSESEPVCINAKVLDESMELLDSKAEIEVLIEPIGHQETIRRKMEPAGNGFYLRIDNMEPGSYAYTIEAKSQGKTITKTGSFSIKEVKAEAGSLVANRALMQRLAAQTGGRHFGYNEIESLQEALLNDESMVPVSYSDTSTSPLMSLKWLFALIVALFSAEWFLRKFWGTN